jgi:pyruvate,water dikinase
MAYTLWLDEVGKEDVALVGGKNAGLGELMRAKIPVPPGFAVTTATYERFLQEGGIQAEVLGILQRVDPQDVERLDEASRRVRSVLESTCLSLELEDAIAERYRRLSRLCHVPAVPVAVRSSATAEDLPGASFAGQQETYLWIRGIDDVLLHIRRCWSSLFTPRAIAYRAKMGYPHQKVSISVGVQKMVNSWTAGVMFTLDPATGDASRIVIDANWGFGESVVSGECTPDQFVVDKVTMQIAARTISRKHCYFTTDLETQTVKKLALPEERQTNQCMIDEDVLNLARMGRAIEKHYGRPMDIEWAIDKDLPSTGNVLILQSRPETVWDRRKQSPVLGRKTGLDLIVERAMKPLKIPKQ